MLRDWARAALSPRPVSRPQNARLACRQGGQGLVEFGLVLPIFLMIMMVAIQLSLLMTAQLALIWVTQDVVRYVSTGTPERWRMADSCHLPYRDSKLPALLRPSKIIQFTIEPAYTPGTGSCTDVAGNVPATARKRGGSIALRMDYDPANLIFLPNPFFGTVIPTTLSWYSASSVLE